MTPATIFPSDNARLTVQLFYVEGAPPFICGVNGGISSTQIEEIEAEYEEDGAEFFDKGDGDYLFAASYDPPQYGEFGRVEVAGNWELDILEFRPIQESTKEPIS